MKKKKPTIYGGLWVQIEKSKNNLNSVEVLQPVTVFLLACAQSCERIIALDQSAEEAVTEDSKGHQGECYTQGDLSFVRLSGYALAEIHAGHWCFHDLCYLFVSLSYRSVI
jgi:hypothetical protein